MSNPEMQMYSTRLMDKLQTIDRAYEEYAKAKGLTYISITVLEIIFAYQDTCTQKLICDQTHYPKQSVNLVVKSFWESGYVELKETTSDRRNKMILLTEKGRKYAEEIITPLWTADEVAVSSLGTQKRDELIRLLEIYGNSYCEFVDETIRNGGNNESTKEARE
ncbi:MarR family winged helix-turn-helix transcriptional regulator [Eubacteriales bacterium OttesenSCG-928-N13]|nr:MarR family winged helix-turn-helix transcriptional regulator [Eubacteriales bacterium OttesenSCG-928-N13]